MKSKITILAILASLTGAAMADNNSVKDFKSTAKINNSCLLSATDVVFGNYDPNNVDHQIAQQVIKFKCTKNAIFTISTYDQSSSSKKNQYGIMAVMKNGTSILNYQVYNPIANFWNDDIDGTNGSTFISKVGTGEEETLYLDYRIIKNQYVRAGNYSGNATTTISF